MGGSGRCYEGVTGRGPCIATRPVDEVVDTSGMPTIIGPALKDSSASVS